MSFINVLTTPAPAAISAAVVAADEVLAGALVFIMVVGVVDLFIMKYNSTAPPPRINISSVVPISPIFFLCAIP